MPRMARSKYLNECNNMVIPLHKTPSIHESLMWREIVLHLGDIKAFSHAQHLCCDLAGSVGSWEH